MTRSPLPEAAAEVAALRRRIAESAPRRGWRPPDDAAVRFATLPLSARTLAGLAAGGFETLKPIQRAAIPHALADRDVLGAARTGSGKTLAFLVPAVEALYRERWAREDGLGALVVSPTRELALQIFGVLRVVGARHDFSAGLITGGRTRDWAAEQARVVRASLLVATPGRALQHLEETPGLDAGRLQALVVDEADRVVDLGFAPQLDAIATYLPAAGARRTWLFSATLAGVGGGGARLARLRALADAATVEFVVARDDRAALLRAGFVEREHLHLLKHDLTSLPPPPSWWQRSRDGARIERGTNADRAAVLALDARTFDEFWHLDSDGLDAVLSELGSLF